MGCLSLKKLRPGSSSSSNVTKKAVTATATSAEKDQEPLYRPTPIHVRIDTIMGVPSIYRAEGGVAAKEPSEKAHFLCHGRDIGGAPVSYPARSSTYSNLLHETKPRERPGVRRFHSAGGGSLCQRRKYPSSPLANNVISDEMSLDEEKEDWQSSNELLENNADTTTKEFAWTTPKERRAVIAKPNNAQSHPVTRVSAEPAAAAASVVRPAPITSSMDFAITTKTIDTPRERRKGSTMFMRRGSGMAATTAGQ